MLNKYCIFTIVFYIFMSMLFATNSLNDSKNITFPCMCTVNNQEQNRLKYWTVNNIESPQ